VKNPWAQRIIDEYSHKRDEDRRFDVPFFRVEYLTTLRYINKYLLNPKKTKLLEIGAATGRYAIPLAQRECEVTAVDLTPKHIKILKEKAKKLNLKNINIHQGCALDLPLENNTFDIVLNLGPLYHLPDDETCKRAISEAVRATKPGGYLFSSFMGDFYIKNRFAKLTKDLAQVGHLNPSPDDIVFRGHEVTQVRSYYDNLNTKEFHMLTTDGTSYSITEELAKMTEKEYRSHLKSHWHVCEHPGMWDHSRNFLHVVQKEEIS